MILRHADVREAARNWEKFSSDAPFRVPIPSEEEVRTMRQLPIETNPPEHTDYRAIVEPIFQRAKQPDTIARVEALIAGKLAEALARAPLAERGDGRPGPVAYDLVYRPPPGLATTPFLARAEALGLRAIDGAGMLVEQGARALSIFLRRPLDDSFGGVRAVMLEAILRALGRAP